MIFKSNDIGNSIMEVLTKGLYSNNLNCFREYVQNSIDTDSEEIRIDITNSGKTISITDNGSGMTEEGLTRALDVGRSSKTDDQVGWRGIGIWSGVAICDRIEIVTKSKDSPKLKIIIYSEPLIRRDSELSLVDILNESVPSEILTLPKSDDDPDSFTMVSLVGIPEVLSNVVNEAEIKKYLRKTVPLRFNEKFLPGDRIVSELEKYNIKKVKARIYVNEEELFKDPQSSDGVFDEPFFHEFFGNDSEGGKKQLLAIGWFVTTDNSRKLENSFVHFKKKLFSIGGTDLVVSCAKKPFRKWQIGEIHVLPNYDGSSFKFTEDASRNGFEISSPEISELYSSVGDYMDNGLDLLTHYTSKKLINLNPINIAFKKEEYKDIKKRYETIINRKEPDPPDYADMSGIILCVNDESQTRENELASIMKDVTQDQTFSKGRLLSEREKEKIEERQRQANKRRLFDELIDNPEVIRNRGKRTKSGKTDPSINMCEPIETALIETRLLTNEDNITQLSKEAFNWDFISHIEQKSIEKGSRLNTPYKPKIKVFDDNNKNKEFGVFLSFLVDMFDNSDKHRDLERLDWYTAMTPEEKSDWADSGWLMVNFAANMIKRVTLSDKNRKV